MINSTVNNEFGDCIHVYACFLDRHSSLLHASPQNRCIHFDTVQNHASFSRARVKIQQTRSHSVILKHTYNIESRSDAF